MSFSAPDAKNLGDFIPTKWNQAMIAYCKNPLTGIHKAKTGCHSIPLEELAQTPVGQSYRYNDKGCRFTVSAASGPLVDLSERPKTFAGEPTVGGFGLTFAIEDLVWTSERSKAPSMFHAERDCIKELKFCAKDWISGVLATEFGGDKDIIIASKTTENPLKKTIVVVALTERGYFLTARIHASGLVFGYTSFNLHLQLCAFPYTSSTGALLSTNLLRGVYKGITWPRNKDLPQDLRMLAHRFVVANGPRWNIPAGQPLPLERGRWADSDKEEEEQEGEDTNKDEEEEKEEQQKDEEEGKSPNKRARIV